MASESGDSNMDREMILADFQVCLFCMTHMCNALVGHLFALVEFPWSVVNNSVHEPAWRHKQQTQAKLWFHWLAHQANILTAC